MNKILTVSSLLIIFLTSSVLPAQDAQPVTPPPAATATPAATPTATAPQQAAAAADAKADAKKQDDKDKVVCRTVRVTGSNVRTQRVCTTPAQEEQSQEWMRKRQDRSGIENGGLIQSGG